MKHWPTLALFVVAAGLAFALYFQIAQHFQPIQSAAAAAKDERSVARRKPAAPPKPQQTPMRFGEYPCQGDCAADKAGYRWAAQNRISDPDDCTGDTAAFIEGCRVYAERQAAKTAGD